MREHPSYVPRHRTSTAEDNLAIPEDADSGMLTESTETATGRMKGCSRVSDLHYTLAPVSRAFKALGNIWALYKVSETRA